MKPVCDTVGRIEGNGGRDSAEKMCGRKNEASVTMAGRKVASNKPETEGSRGVIPEEKGVKERYTSLERLENGQINGKEDTHGAGPHEEGRLKTRADNDVEHREIRASPPETCSKLSQCIMKDIKGITTIDDCEANGCDANAQTKRVPIDLSTLSSFARDKLARPPSSLPIQAKNAEEKNRHAQCGVDASIGCVVPNGGGGCSKREEDKKEREPGMKEVVTSITELSSKTAPDGSAQADASENKDGNKESNSSEIAEQMVLENHKDIRTSSDVENGEQVKDIVAWKSAQGERQNEGEEGEKKGWEEKRGDDEDQSQEKLKRENLYFENEPFKSYDPTIPDVPDPMLTKEKDTMDDKRDENEKKSSLECHVHDADITPATEQESVEFTRKHSDLQDSSAGKCLSSNEMECQESNSAQRQWTPEERDNQMNAQKVEAVQILVEKRDALEGDPDMVTKRIAVEKISKLEQQNCEKHMAQMESKSIDKTKLKLSMFQRTVDGEDYESTGKKESNRRHHLLRHVLPEDTCLDVILKHFDVETCEEAALKIQSLSQRELQSAFEIVYGKKALSNNNQWLRKKLTDALPLTEKAICTTNNDRFGQDKAARDSAFQSHPADPCEISRKRRKKQDSSFNRHKSNCIRNNGSTEDYLLSLDGRDSRKSRRKASEGVQAATAALLRDPELEALEREDARWLSSRLKLKQRKQTIAPESVKSFSDIKQDLGGHQQDMKKLDEKSNSEREMYLHYLLDGGKSSEMLSSYSCEPSVRQPNIGINGQLSYLMNGKEMKDFRKFVSTGDFSNEEKYTSSVHNVPMVINEEAQDSVCEKKMLLDNAPIHNFGTNLFGIDASITGKIPPVAEKDRVGSDRYMEVPESNNDTTFDDSHQANLLKEKLEAMFYHASAKMKDFHENSMAQSASGYYNLSSLRDYSGAMSSEKLQTVNRLNQSNFNISPEITILEKLLSELQQSNINNLQGALRLMSILVASISEKWNMYLHAGNELEKKMEQHQKECHLQSLMLESLHKQIQEEVDNRLHEHYSKEASSHIFNSCSDMHSRDNRAPYYIPETAGNACHAKNSNDLESFDLKSKLYAQIAELTNIGESLKNETVNAPGSSYKASNLLRNVLSQADFNNRLN